MRIMYNLNLTMRGEGFWLIQFECRSSGKNCTRFHGDYPFRKWSETVRLYPLASMDAKEVFELMTTVIAGIEKCNLNVVVLCSNHSPINQNIYKLFSRRHVIEQSVSHPCTPIVVYSSFLILSTSLNVFVTIGLTNMMLSGVLFSLF